MSKPTTESESGLPLLGQAFNATPKKEEAVLFIVCGPSGSGKTSLVEGARLAIADVLLSVSHTTREPRKDEVDGVHYHFVTESAFLSLQQQGVFLETAQVHGNWYGTSRQWLKQQFANKQDVILEIDWQGARQVRKEWPHAVGIFIMPPNFAALEARL